MREKIGFRHESPLPPDRFGERLRREVSDPRGSARLRWLSLAAFGLYALGRVDLAPWFQTAREHPILIGGLVVFLICVLPLLMIIPANIFNLEMQVFEVLRRVAYVILGGKALCVFILAFALEGVALGSILFAVRGQHPQPLEISAGKNQIERPAARIMGSA